MVVPYSGQVEGGQAKTSWTCSAAAATVVATVPAAAVAATIAAAAADAVALVVGGCWRLFVVVGGGCR